MKKILPKKNKDFSFYRFSVLDEDAIGADFLGEFRLKLSTLKPDLREAYSVYLQNKTEVRKFFSLIIPHYFLFVFS